MVTMQMGDKHCADFGKTQARTAQLHLSTLATINQKQFAPDFYDLCRSIMMQSGQCATTAQDMNSEWLQNNYKLHKEFILGILQA